MTGMQLACMIRHLSLQAKRKYLEILQEKQNLEADRAELQQKYAQKAQQARKLQDMFSKASNCNPLFEPSCALCPGLEPA